MTTVRMIAAHEVVRRAYPRPPPDERDQLAMATGKAIDSALAQFGHEIRSGRRPTQAAIGRFAESELDECLAEVALVPEMSGRLEALEEVREVLRAYRSSVIAGLPRPRTRVILIGDRVGVYAQPDYWDGRARFYEMKSYRAIPPPPDVSLQLRLFQLAFPTFEAVLVCFDRRRRPVAVDALPIPAPCLAEAHAALRLAYETGQELGVPKILEYVDGDRAHYPLPPPGEVRPGELSAGPGA